MKSTIRVFGHYGVESKDEFCKQLHATTKRRNKNEAKTNWQFTTDDARIKLRSLYPSLQF